MPSGTLWATCNIGADTPESYGDYFAWGETAPKSTYNFSTYKYASGSDDKLTKYCNDSESGNDGFTDNLVNLQSGDDPATANWGSDWRMPTHVEWLELYQNTTVTWTQQNGVNGMLFTSMKNGQSLFLPAAGTRERDVFVFVGSGGDYWSSSLYTDNPDYAWYFRFDSDIYDMDYIDRCEGHSVRAVRSARQK